MNGIVITTDNTVEIREFEHPFYKTVGAVVGGYVEHVKPHGLPQPYCMLVNEEGRLEGLLNNDFGCILYGTALHGEPIVGDIVIMKDGFCDGEPDIVGLENAEAMRLAKLFVGESFGILKMKEERGCKDA